MLQIDLAAVVRPKIGRQIQRYRLGRASVVVAGDLEDAFTIAARQRKPVRLALSGGTYTLSDRSGGTVRLQRPLTADREGSTSQHRAGAVVTGLNVKLGRTVGVSDVGNGTKTCKYDCL